MLYGMVADDRMINRSRDNIDLKEWARQRMTAISPGRYRHSKGNEYTVLGVARHSETLEEMIVYRQEYGDRGLWVRPAVMFGETVVIDGVAVPRFQRIEEGSGS
jgi:hypothetical protein